MRRTVIAAVLVSAVLLAGCGPASGGGTSPTSSSSGSSSSGGSESWATACPLTAADAAAIVGRAVPQSDNSSVQNCGYDGGSLGLGVQRWPDDLAGLRSVWSARGETRDRPDLGPGVFELYDPSNGYPTVELGFAQDDGTYRSRTVVAGSPTMSRAQLRTAAERVLAAVR